MNPFVDIALTIFDSSLSEFTNDRYYGFNVRYYALRAEAVAKLVILTILPLTPFILPLEGSISS